MQVQSRIRQLQNVSLSRRMMKLALLLFATALPALQAEMIHLRSSQPLFTMARGRSGGESLASELRTPDQVSKALARAEAGSAHDQFLIGYAYANGVGQ